MSTIRAHRRTVGGRGQGGFSLVEILMAVMILGLGMIMIAGIFPVGATWTRQVSEETLGSIIARNAVSILQTKLTAQDMAGVTDTTLRALPAAAMNRLPLAERAYAFGSMQPYPAADPTRALYYWTALARRTPSGMPNQYEVYVFVFKKGEAEQKFTQGVGEGRGDSDPDTVPWLLQGDLGDTAFLANSQGVKIATGTVFRKISNTATNTSLEGDSSKMFFAPAADGTKVSPLVYVYQTTLTF